MKEHYAIRITPSMLEKLQTGATILIHVNRGTASHYVQPVVLIEEDQEANVWEVKNTNRF